MPLSNFLKLAQTISDCTFTRFIVMVQLEYVSIDSYYFL